MNDNKQTASGGIGFVGLLTILFIALKLTNVIDWSWWWVLSPIWITAATILLLVAPALVMWGYAKILMWRDRKR